jgi:hypothetical protein
MRCSKSFLTPSAALYHPAPTGFAYLADAYFSLNGRENTSNRPTNLTIAVKKQLTEVPASAPKLLFKLHIVYCN